ncbi:7899_t:CDS:1, partial [Ambispora gerdemannii]
MNMSNNNDNEYNDNPLSQIRPPHPPTLHSRELLRTHLFKSSKNAKSAYIVAYLKVLSTPSASAIVATYKTKITMARNAWDQEPNNVRQAYKKLADETRSIMRRRNAAETTMNQS